MRLLSSLALICCALCHPAFAADASDAKIGEAYVQALKSQRNDAADQAAILSARLIATTEQLTTARAEIERLKKAAPTPAPAPSPPH